MDIKCPNLHCGSHDTSQGHIIFYGKYKTKKSGTQKRFLCKVCGRTFVNNQSSIDNIRNAKSTYIQCIRLSVNGVSIRSISKILDIKEDTVRRWHQYAINKDGVTKNIFLEGLKVKKSDWLKFEKNVKDNRMRIVGENWNNMCMYNPVLRDYVKNKDAEKILLFFKNINKYK